MGLAYDVNKAIPIKRGFVCTFEDVYILQRFGIDQIEVEEMDLGAAKAAGSVEEQRKRLAEKESELLKKRAAIKGGKLPAKSTRGAKKIQKTVEPNEPEVENVC